MNAVDTLSGKRATVVGLGIEGVALVRYLVTQGAQVTVTDAKPADALDSQLAQIAGLRVQLALGGNRPEDCVGADIVFVSQGVPLDLPALAAARAWGIPLSSATRLFMERCPCPIVGITGSAGKTTTTALTGAMFRAAGRPALVGGNIGVVLLDRLADLSPLHWVVLEMSHTQLELTDRSPRVAVVTNISPSHADRYPLMADYVALKRRIFAAQGAGDVLVINWDDAETRAMGGDAPGRTAHFSLQGPPSGDGAFVCDGNVVVRWDGRETAVMPVDQVRLIGEHNLANVLAACAAATAAGLPAAALGHAVGAFEGVEHRLEWVRTVGSVDYYNDSIATTPDRTAAGLRCFDRPIVLLAGGREKHLPLEPLTREVRRHCRAVVFFGEAGPVLRAGVTPGWPQGEHRLVPTLEAAVTAAAGLAQPGDLVLLSPACTSFDAFPNFETRGRRFKELVAALPGADPTEEGVR